MPYKDPEKVKNSARLRQKKYRDKNKEKLNIINLGRYHSIYKKDESVKEKKKEYLANWRKENQKKIKDYRQNNEEQRAKARTRAIKWQKDNPGKANANSTIRKKRVKQAMPNWVFLKDIQTVYVKSVELEKKTGVKYHVDHIIPLVHEKVCGLHVPWNLQVIPAHDNLMKGNRF